MCFSGIYCRACFIWLCYKEKLWNLIFDIQIFCRFHKNESHHTVKPLSGMLHQYYGTPSRNIFANVHILANCCFVILWLHNPCFMYALVVSGSAQYDISIIYPSIVCVPTAFCCMHFWFAFCLMPTVFLSFILALLKNAFISLMFENVWCILFLLAYVEYVVRKCIRYF